MRALFQTKERAHASAHPSRAKKNRPHQRPILSPGTEIGPIRGLFFSWRAEIGLIQGPFFSGRLEIGLIQGPFFGASPKLARRTPDTPLARWQGKAPTKAPRSIPFVREGTRGKGRVRETCDAPGCRRGAGTVCRPSMSPWNPLALVSWVAECKEGTLRDPTPKHPPTQIGGLWCHRVRAPRRLAASHVFASLKRLGQGCAPTPRGGLRCALAARRVQAWEGRP
jgi:hypothetical protein